MAQPLSKTDWKFAQELNIYPPHDLNILPLSTRSREKESYVPTKIFTQLKYQ